MQIGSKFTIGVHIITAIDYFKDVDRVNSEFLAGSIGVNPVIVRTVISQLREAGIVQTQRGSSGAELTKRLDEITLYDIYKAVGSVDTEEGLFHFHEQPNPDCPVGRNIHKVLDQRLIDVSMSSRTRTALWAETSTRCWISVSLMHRKLWKRNSDPQRLPISWKIQGRQSTMNRMKKRSNLS